MVNVLAFNLNYSTWFLQHPFVTGEYQESHPVNRTSVIVSKAFFKSEYQISISSFMFLFSNLSVFNTQRDHSGKHMEISKANLRNS